VQPPIRYPVTDGKGHPKGAGHQAAQPLPTLGKGDGLLRERLMKLGRGKSE